MVVCCRCVTLRDKQPDVGPRIWKIHGVMMRMDNRIN